MEFETNMCTDSPLHLVLYVHTVPCKN